jgi:predicted TPR repeat methyltransferase
METRKAYDTWASQYDTSDNKTRDLEGLALRTVLANISFDSVLEIGCGTGKNTEWLIGKVKEITSTDFSEKNACKSERKNNFR